MKFKIISSIIVVVVLIVAAILFSGSSTVDADGNQVTIEVQQ